MNFINIPAASVRPCHAWAVVKAVAELVHVAVDGPWIAGGSVRRALRNEAVSDVDLFVPTLLEADVVRGLLPAPDLVTELATSHRVMLTDVSKAPILVQVVTVAMAPKLTDVLALFDFNEAALGYDGLRVMVAEAGLLGLLRNHLSINPECKGQFPGVTARRIVKYAEAGLKPCTGTLIDLLKLAGVPDTKLEVKYVD